MKWGHFWGAFWSSSIFWIIEIDMKEGYFEKLLIFLDILYNCSWHEKGTFLWAFSSVLWQRQIQYETLSHSSIFCIFEVEHNIAQDGSPLLNASGVSKINPIYQILSSFTIDTWNLSNSSKLISHPLYKKLFIRDFKDSSGRDCMCERVLYAWSVLCEL